MCYVNDLSKHGSADFQKVLWSRFPQGFADIKHLTTSEVENRMCSLQSVYSGNTDFEDEKCMSRSKEKQQKWSVIERRGSI